MRIAAAVAVFVVSSLVLGNALILGTSWWMRARLPASADLPVPGVNNVRAVDAKVWRGARPSVEGYRALVAAGVTTVVDLRAEDYADDLHPAAERLGLRVVHLPVRDGQLPSDAEIDAFLKLVDSSKGRVFVHCGAGVGRTGAMAAAYLVATGQTSGRQALARNLSVGPPSLEQIWFAGRLTAKHDRRPPATIVLASRFLDAPRRIWHNL